MTDAMSKYLRQQGTKLVEEHCGSAGDSDANPGQSNPVQFIQVGFCNQWAGHTVLRVCLSDNLIFLELIGLERPI